MSIDRVVTGSVNAAKKQMKLTVKTIVEKKVPEAAQKMIEAAKEMTGATALSSQRKLEVVGFSAQSKKLSKTQKSFSKISGADFSKLEGEIDKDGRKIVRNAEGTMIRKYFPGKGGTLHAEEVYDPTSGKCTKSIIYKDNGKFDIVCEFDSKSGARTKAMGYYPNGKMKCLNEFDPQTGRLTRITEFRENGKKWHVRELQNGECVRESNFRRDGALSSISEFAPQSRSLTRLTQFFRRDGKTMSTVTDYGYRGRLSREYYDADGTLVKSKSFI